MKLWCVSPATTPSEVIQLRSVITRALVDGHLFYVFASIICVVVAIISAASTTISNHAIASNIVIRQSVVQGRLVTSEHSSLSSGGSAGMNVSARVKALNKANAPLTQLFDFTPDDSSGWVFDDHEWNNTWQGNCTYSKYPAVDLVVYPTNSTNYQDEVPLLGKWLPEWATVDPNKQGTAYSGFYTDALTNGTGDWRDQLVTYAFGSGNGSNFALGTRVSSLNISFANYLAHHIGRDPNTTYLLTSFTSDVHVVECTFYNSVPAIEDQAHPDTGNYVNAATYVASVSFSLPSS